MCPWCGAETACRHRVAKFDGELVRLEGDFAPLAETIKELVTEAFDCIVDGDPVPVPLAHEGLPGGNTFLTGLKRSWVKMRRHADCDGDFEGWRAILSSETQFQSAEWILSLIWALGEGPIQIEDGEGGEYWYCGTPDHLMEGLLDGLECKPGSIIAREGMPESTRGAEVTDQIRICGG